jgi:outer membrane protein OmpA-like peptidoglycan-associated protein
VKNNGYTFLVVLLVSLAGCGGKKTKKAEVREDKNEVMSNVDIPVADDGIRSFFDEEVGEFKLADEKDEKTKGEGQNDFAWEDVDQKGQNFKEVYFEFDRFNIKTDQEQSVAYNIEQIKKSLDQAKERGVKPVVVIEGHACHSAGSAVYNLALSEKRAKVLADTLIQAGVPQEHIKIVGRGQEVPAIIDGKAVTGSRQEQWPNRRDEVRLIHS